MNEDMPDVSSLGCSLLSQEIQVLDGLEKIEEMKREDLGPKYTEDEGLEWEKRHRAEINKLHV